MSTTITIGNTPIEFPDSGEDPNWAAALLQFAQAVEEAIESTAGPYDVPPQILNIDADNPGTATIPFLSFSVSAVRAVNVRYSVYRTTSSVTNSYEQGMLYLVYNAGNATNSKWEISREYTGNGASISFTISDAGQVSYTTTTLGGISHFGRLAYSAVALEQT